MANAIRIFTNIRRGLAPETDIEKLQIELVTPENLPGG